MCGDRKVFMYVQSWPKVLPVTLWEFSVSPIDLLRSSETQLQNVFSLSFKHDKDGSNSDLEDKFHWDSNHSTRILRGLLTISWTKTNNRDCFSEETSARNDTDMDMT